MNRMATQTGNPLPRPGRDPRADICRGLALWMIVINHTPGNWLGGFTLKNFAFADATEAFVLLAGYAGAFAYAGQADRQGWAPAAASLVRRIAKLYVAHIFLLVVFTAQVGFSAATLDRATYLDELALDPFAEQPYRTLLEALLLRFQPHFLDILPLYIVLLAASPLMLWLAWHMPLVLLVASVALWLMTGFGGWNLPNHPSPAGWYFNPLAWQLIFVIGILIATAMKQGRRLVPATPWLLVPACAILVFGLVHQRVAPWSDVSWVLPQQANLHDIFTSVQKTFLPLQRLIHALALAYVLSYFPIVRQICASRPLAPFALLGRHALPVFATICVLNFAMQVVRVKTGVDFALDTAMLAGALATVLALAAARHYWPKVA